MRDRAAIEAVAREMGANVATTLPQFVEQMEVLLTCRVHEGMIGV